MTDINPQPTVEPRRPSIKFPKLPRLGFGKVFDAMLKCYGGAQHGLCRPSATW